MDPDYMSTSKVTKKSDIYSFGIIIFELVTAINPQQGLMEYIDLVSSLQGSYGMDTTGCIHLCYFYSILLSHTKLLARLGYARLVYIGFGIWIESCGILQAVAGEDGKADWEEILDERLVGKCNLEEVKLLADVAYKCLHKVPKKRPSVSEVTQSISRIKQGHLTNENSMLSQAGDASGLVERIEVQQIVLSRIASRVDCSSPRTRPDAAAEQVACK